MTGGRAEILLAEDNPADAELVVQALAAARVDAKTHVVHDGVEALDYLFCRGAYSGRQREDRPRVVLLDIKLPRVDGFEVLTAMKNDPRTRAIPVVMLTSSNVDRDVARCFRLGANSYVQKPVHFDEFQETVGRIGLYWLKTSVQPPASAFGEPEQ